MSAAAPTHENREIPAFPDWLDLPEGYLVNDWIQWQKGKAVAKRLRINPALVDIARQNLEAKRSGLSLAHLEWLDLLHSHSAEDIAWILESADGNGQRLRSSSPFSGRPFVEPVEIEAIRERAYLG